jgi:hypothetical protein
MITQLGLCAKNKLILQRSDDSEGQRKKKYLRILFILCLKNVAFVIIHNLEIKMEGSKNRSLRRIRYLVDNIL